ncbi:NAD-dependent epimerase/dehydratase family protein [Patescibacteria group bacterium]|nr:NAD-dependent epimerase/dehydratase family protein [Patescibacteria group bacterium]
MQHTVFITGAGGYVGAMLVRKFAARDDVKTIVGIDKESLPDLIKDEAKLIYIQKNLSDAGWEEEVLKYQPDIVIHAAWQIREMYGQKETQWKWNIDGSDRVFHFCFNHDFVKRLVHFSTVASYGARKENSVDHFFTEAEGFRKSDYLYAEEKRVVEERLEEKYGVAKERGRDIQIAIVRPAAITGPRGRYMRIRFGLQAALSGQLKESFVHKLISLMVSFVPATRTWLRQFIHEDDVVRIVELLAFSPLKKSYDAFNICPPGAVVRAPDMAKAVGKRVIYVHPQLIRLMFFIMWHGTRGRVPTSRGGWKSYSYPIAVDGSKLTREYGFEYSAPSLDAFYYTNGEYESYVPQELRRHK